MTESLSSIIQDANTVLLDDGELDRIDEFFAPDYVAHATGQDMTGGPSAVRSFLESLHSTFAKLQVDVEILLEDGDRIAWLRTLRGTQRSAFHGFPATNLEVMWRDMVTSRLADGKIAEEWVVTDLAEQLLRTRKRSK